ncbi:MAG: hypothetical protein B7Y99_11285 [Caulobacterales bacterium 32-69-10]|nr:MAG: hypothetical protein B7Y99_11285 [Caulobacterales bacterium 32-69-10]
MLAELAEIGMEMARAAGRRACALAESDEASGLDPALSYARAARAVRLTIALQSRLLSDLAALDGAETKARAAEAFKRRDRIHRRVETIIEAERADADEAEQLSSDVWERLTDADESAVLDRPIDEVVAQICQDLGLSPMLAAQAWAAPAFTDADDEEPAAFGSEPMVPLGAARASAPITGLNSS